MELNDLIKIDKKQMFKAYNDWPDIARSSFEENFDKILFEKCKKLYIDLENN